MFLKIYRKAWTYLINRFVRNTFIPKIFFLFRFNQLCCHLLLASSAARVPRIFFDKTSNESKNNQPKIVVSGTEFTTYDCIANEEYAFDIKIEDTTTCWCNPFVRAFLVIIALPHVFNVTYSEKIEPTMAFIQRMWPEINDNQKIPPKVLSLICRIKKLGSWLWPFMVYVFFRYFLWHFIYRFLYLFS